VGVHKVGFEYNKLKLLSFSPRNLKNANNCWIKGRTKKLAVQLPV